MTNPKPTDILELRKDISMPNKYQRAGHTATASLWEQEFPCSTTGIGWREWFINLSEPPKPEPPKDLLRDLVRKVFAERKLASFSYMDATCEVVRLWDEQKSENVKS